MPSTYLFIAEVKEFLELDTTVRESTECALLLEIGGDLGVSDRDRLVVPRLAQEPMDKPPVISHTHHPCWCREGFLVNLRCGREEKQMSKRLYICLHKPAPKKLNLDTSLSRQNLQVFP